MLTSDPCVNEKLCACVSISYIKEVTMIWAGNTVTTNVGLEFPQLQGSLHFWVASPNLAWY